MVASMGATLNDTIDVFAVFIITIIKMIITTIALSNRRALTHFCLMNNWSGDKKPSCIWLDYIMGSLKYDNLLCYNA